MNTGQDMTKIVFSSWLEACPKPQVSSQWYHIVTHQEVGLLTISNKINLRFLRIYFGPSMQE